MNLEPKKFSITFFGTHDFGAAMLRALLSDPEFTIDAAVTQPDRPVGRNHELEQSAVKKVALQNGFSILQPESLKIQNSKFEIRDSDIFVVCQYGLIIPQWVLDIPKRGTINVHTSLLPKYRGASPIQTALINGEKETGVTIMLMDAKMDHGPILAQEKVAIESDDTYLVLSKKMETTAAPLLVRSLYGWLNNEIAPKEQNHDSATFCKMFTRDDGKIDWSKTADEIYNLYRGLTPWPGIWTMWKEKRLKLLKIDKSELAIASQLGQIKYVDGTLYIACAQGTIQVLELQLEGKKIMGVREFISGYGALL